MFLVAISYCFLFPIVALFMDKLPVLMLLKLYLKIARHKTITITSKKEDFDCQKDKKHK